MTSPATRLTIDDFERLPDEQAKNHELVDGELIDVSGNTPENNSIRDFLIEVLRPFIREHGLGRVIAEQEFDFGGNVYGPDVSFFGPAKLPLLDRHKRVQPFVPDLAVEVVSPNNLLDTFMRKKDRYRKCGTAEVWIVSPESREVYVYCEPGDRNLRGDAELTSGVLPGFRILVKQLFETA
jgi:Uma2 family endonuclease